MAQFILSDEEITVIHEALLTEEKTTKEQIIMKESAEYGGVPISIEDKSGKVQTSFAKRF